MKTYLFRVRVVSDTYNEETRLKHSVVAVTEADWKEVCIKYIEMIEKKEKCQVPPEVKRLVVNCTS